MKKRLVARAGLLEEGLTLARLTLERLVEELLDLLLGRGCVSAGVAI